MDVVTQSGTLYTTEPVHGPLIMTDRGVSEVFHLSVFRTDGDVRANSGHYRNAYWLSTVVIGEPMIIAVDDGAGVLETSPVAEILRVAK